MAEIYAVAHVHPNASFSDYLSEALLLHKRRLNQYTSELWCMNEHQPWYAPFLLLRFRAHQVCYIFEHFGYGSSSDTLKVEIALYDSGYLEDIRKYAGTFDNEWQQQKAKLSRPYEHKGGNMQFSISVPQTIHIRKPKPS